MKKGQGLPVNTMILIILGLVVLVIIIILVQQQVKKGSTKYTNLSDEAEIRSDKCGNLFMGRACSNSCDPAKGQKQVYRPTGDWEDCKEQKKAACCEST